VCGLPDAGIGLVTNRIYVVPAVTTYQVKTARASADRGSHVLQQGIRVQGSKLGFQDPNLGLRVDGWL
jgi:hypothetical protein